MEELIRKQDALDAIHCDITVTGRQNAELVAATIGAFADRIKALPPVQPEILASGEGELNVPDTDVEDMISRQAAIDALDTIHYTDREDWWAVLSTVENLPTVQPESCEGCKHLGKWENEVEYGYPSPCTRCKRRAEDHYER